MGKILSFCKPIEQPITIVHVLANAYAEYKQKAASEGFAQMFKRFDNFKTRVLPVESVWDKAYIGKR